MSIWLIFLSECSMVDKYKMKQIQADLFATYALCYIYESASLVIHMCS